MQRTSRISSSSWPTAVRIRIEAGSVSPTARSTGETGTILVQALFPNPDGILRPGLYAKVRAADGNRSRRAPRAGARGAGDPGHVSGRGRRRRTTRSRYAR